MFIYNQLDKGLLKPRTIYDEIVESIESFPVLIVLGETLSRMVVHLSFRKFVHTL